MPKMRIKGGRSQIVCVCGGGGGFQGGCEPRIELIVKCKISWEGGGGGGGGGGGVRVVVNHELKLL